MPYKIVELELSKPVAPIALAADQDGYAIVFRWHDRLAGFHMAPAPAGAVISAEQQLEIAGRRFGRRLLTFEVEHALQRTLPAGIALRPPSLTVAICTKDRAQRLARLLRSIAPAHATSPFRSTEVLVIDNASGDDETRKAAAAFGFVRYAFEPRPGLDFARNAALRHATGELLAFLDDDVVIDRHWLAGLFAAWEACPEAGGFTGLVLPHKLDTEAQIQFEGRGGFGRGFNAKRFHAASASNRMHPVGAGSLGAGCNMAFDRSLLLAINGFDEALDTGAPLPGGGDLDIFYRVLRTGRTMVYEPRYAVYHEHRETIPQLRRQYWTWGLGFMAYLAKSRRHDQALRAKQRAIIRWWLFDKAADLVKAGLKLRLQEFRFVAAELWGGIVGISGEYDRSLSRIKKIRDQLP